MPGVPVPGGPHRGRHLCIERLPDEGVSKRQTAARIREHPGRAGLVERGHESGDRSAQHRRQIGDRELHCDDLGPDTTYKNWHLGTCTVKGEATSLNEFMVKRGFAMNSATAGKSRFGEDETDAKNNRRGLWRGCFVAPHEFRTGRKDGALPGGACRSDKDREIREALFPQELTMPSGCGIKGKYALRARVTGNVGIYHLQMCASYPALTRPDRWFCSEDDAKAAGFRKAYNCRPFTRQRS